MLERMSDEPAGTVGFEAFGTVEADDFEHCVEPVLRADVADGRRDWLPYLLGRDLSTRRTRWPGT